MEAYHQTLDEYSPRVFIITAVVFTRNTYLSISTCFLTNRWLPQAVFEHITFFFLKVCSIFQNTFLKDSIIQQYLINTKKKKRRRLLCSMRRLENICA